MSEDKEETVSFSPAEDLLGQESPASFPDSGSRPFLRMPAGENSFGQSLQQTEVEYHKDSCEGKKKKKEKNTEQCKLFRVSLFY